MGEGGVEGEKMGSPLQPRSEGRKSLPLRGARETKVCHRGAREEKVYHRGAREEKVCHGGARETKVCHCEERSDVAISSFLFIVIRHFRMPTPPSFPNVDPSVIPECIYSGIWVFSFSFGPLIETFRGDGRGWTPDRNIQG